MGRYYRRSDSRIVQRYFCKRCTIHFSQGTRHPCYRQNKRQVNEMLRRLLCSGVSQRRASKILNLSRTTVVRKFLFLASQALSRLERGNLGFTPASVIEFDEMETFEHTKCKPLSITLAVESRTRRILGFEVSQMPAKGLLAQISRKKYGLRDDLRKAGRHKLFERILPLVDSKALIKSDENPHYPLSVRTYFPNCRHEVHKGRRGCVVGQGELKKIGFDPLFSLNHTCARLRADMNRLFRRTWCTTKRPDRLFAHLALCADYHNQSLFE